MPTARPRRSVLYMPGSNPRALAKGKTLAADGLIFDLEDAVAPESKVEARNHIVDALKSKNEYGSREIVIRTNGLDSEWGADDLIAMCDVGADAILLPKVENSSMVDQALDKMGVGSRGTAIWCMMETPRGIMHAEEIADHPNVTCLVMGTSDLTKDLRSLHTPMRLPMLSSLSWCLLAARAANIAILDGVHLDLADTDGFSASCKQGRELGFDGKTLIHPKQLDAANECFAPDHETIVWSKKIIAAFEESKALGKGVTLVEGKLVENLHVAEARRLLELADMIDAMKN